MIDDIVLVHLRCDIAQRPGDAFEHNGEVGSGDDHDAMCPAMNATKAAPPAATRNALQIRARLIMSVRR
jgi:hypothetical protein